MSRVYTAESSIQGTGVFSSAHFSPGEFILWINRRQHISGFFHLPVDIQARYLALLEDWFVAEHREEVEILKRRIEKGLR